MCWKIKLRPHAIQTAIPDIGVDLLRGGGESLHEKGGCFTTCCRLEPSFTLGGGVNYYRIADKRITMNGGWISTSIGGGTLHDKEVDFYIEGGGLLQDSSESLHV